MKLRKILVPLDGSPLAESALGEGIQLAGAGGALVLLRAAEAPRVAVGDPVEATLASPVSVSGVQVLPAGSPVRGEVTGVQQSGKVKGRASLELTFTNVTARGESYPLGGRFSMVAPSGKKRDAEKIALPAAGGAIVGAIVGGGKGAAIGAVAGGAGGVMATKGNEVQIEPGTVVTALLQEPITVSVLVR